MIDDAEGRDPSVGAIQRELERLGWRGTSGDDWVDHWRTTASGIALHVQYLPGSGALLLSAETDESVEAYRVVLGADVASTVKRVSDAADLVDGRSEAFAERLRRDGMAVDQRREDVGWEDEAGEVAGERGDERPFQQGGTRGS